MKRVFSYSEKPILFILNILPSILPGVEKVIAVYYSHESGSVKSDSIRNVNGEYFTESFHISDHPSVFIRLRMDNAQYTWMRKEDLAFEIQTKEKVQIEIFNELNNNILLLRIPNTFDNRNDLIFIFFNQDLSNFGTLSSNKILSTDNKTIIAHVVRNSVLAFLGNLQSDKELSALLHENTRAIIRERNTLRDELGITKEKYQDGLIRLALSYLADMETDTVIRYRLSESAVAKLRGFSGDIGTLKPVIEKAAHFAETMNLDGIQGDVLISDFHLIADEQPGQPKTETVSEVISDIPAKYIKTVMLLDKLEKAALHVKSKNKLLTGANLGSEFPTPISPPAISDALKKHKQKILYLFREYPGRWGIIRNEFRPVQNILNAKPFNEQLSA